MKNLKKLFSVACHIKTTRHYLKKPAALCDVLLSKRSSIECIKISYTKYYKTRKLYLLGFNSKFSESKIYVASHYLRTSYGPQSYTE